MTNKEAIEILKEYEIVDDSLKWYIPECGEAFDMAIKALESQQWIPIKEALPDDEEYVLITTVYASSPFYASFPEVLIGRRYDDNAWYILGGCEDSYTNKHITAWTKLPEPYQEDKK